MTNAAPPANACEACRALFGQASEHAPHPHLTPTLGGEEGDQFICRECGTRLARGSLDQEDSRGWGPAEEESVQSAVVEAKASGSDAVAPATADDVQSVAVNPANAD